MYGEGAIYFINVGQKEYRKVAEKQANKAFALIENEASSDRGGSTPFLTWVQRARRAPAHRPRPARGK